MLFALRTAEYVFLGTDFLASFSRFNCSFCSSVIWGLKGSLISLSGGLLVFFPVPLDLSVFLGDEVELDFELDLVTRNGVSEMFESVIIFDLDVDSETSSSFSRGTFL